MHPSTLKGLQTKRYNLSIDPLANQPGTVFAKGSRRHVNDLILNDAGFGWRDTDPVAKINLRALDDGAIVALYRSRDPQGNPIVTSYQIFNARKKSI